MLRDNPGLWDGTPLAFGRVTLTQCSPACCGTTLGCVMERLWRLVDSWFQVLR